MVVLAAALAGCAAPRMTIRQDYDFQKIRRVAVLGFRDFPGKSGSGEIVAGAFESSLLAASYTLIERQQVDQVLAEGAFSRSGAVDPKTARKLGRILGADALVLGSVVDFSPQRNTVIMAEIPGQEIVPTRSRRTHRVKKGDRWVVTEEDDTSGYRIETTMRHVPQTYTIRASVGASARMVAVETGEVLWAGSHTETGVNLQEAADDLAAHILHAVKHTWPKPAEKP